MELGEALRLAETFILSLLFKVHSLPIDPRSDQAARWWQGHDSRIPLRPALEEQRRHLSLFASRRQAERQRGRHLFLTISATVRTDGRGRCPALRDGLCSIYEARPLTCRTVPMHYSRPSSTLRDYLDRFTATPDYLCATGEDAPIVLEGSTIVDPAVRDGRERAIALAKADRAWKDRLLALMDDEALARTNSLPTYDDVLRNSDSGFATSLPIIVAWQVAKRAGLLASEAFGTAKRGQAALIGAEIAHGATGAELQELIDMLALYEAPPALLATPNSQNTG